MPGIHCIFSVIGSLPAIFLYLHITVNVQIISLPIEPNTKVNLSNCLYDDWLYPQWKANPLEASNLMIATILLKIFTKYSASRSTHALSNQHPIRDDLVINATIECK
ncbi:hypothetical protein TNIN_171281 [Trichonephila inaurata madagascariensis]|uniref:Uncharacterized protein n=1 Tax=Trichonephila inaurata madagascariensis TaxID=2747483 RepID=A0A8X6YW86_9ARAC|nr:hypothetical protein TNIN_171281 [Trichonephila inaurata madagascariensis]